MPLHFVLLRPAWATAGWRCHIYFCPPAAEALLAPALGSHGARADRAGVVICPLAPSHNPLPPGSRTEHYSKNTVRTGQAPVPRRNWNEKYTETVCDFCLYSRFNSAQQMIVPLRRDLCTCFRITSEICNVWQNKHIVCIPQSCMSNISLMGLRHPNTRSSPISK